MIKIPSLSDMKTYLQMDGDKLVEYVEKREYDGLSLLAHELATLRAEDMATINDLRKQLQDAVKRMEAVTDADLVLAYWAGSHSTLVHEGANRVRARLIQAAKGES